MFDKNIFEQFLRYRVIDWEEKDPKFSIENVPWVVNQKQKCILTFLF